MIAPLLYATWARDLGVSRCDQTRMLCFADQRFGRVAYRVFDQTRAVAPMEVTLGPTRRIRVPIKLGAFATHAQRRLSSAVVLVPCSYLPQLPLVLIGRTLILRGRAEEILVEEDLPEGTYQLVVRLIDPVADPGGAVGLGEAKRELVVPKGEGPLDLAPVELEPPALLKMVGKPAPEIEATDLDSGRPVRLADFRGKVVVLDFWGYWCGVCTGRMPHLAELHRKFEGRPLAVVALHDQSAQTREEYNRKIAVTRERLWGGRDLPFRVLLDRPDPKKPDDVLAEATGTTIKRYGITRFPTLIVIDRDGTFVETVPFWNHDRLESLIQELVERAENH